MFYVRSKCCLPQWQSTVVTSRSLVWCIQRFFMFCDLCKNLLYGRSPNEGLRILVLIVEIFVGSRNQSLDTLERATPQSLFSNLAEPPFHHQMRIQFRLSFKISNTPAGYLHHLVVPHGGARDFDSILNPQSTIRNWNFPLPQAKQKKNRLCPDSIARTAQRNDRAADSGCQVPGFCPGNSCALRRAKKSPRGKAIEPAVGKRLQTQASAWHRAYCAQIVVLKPVF
jgi:hypothetical protein